MKTMDLPSLSVVMPCFNQARFVRESVQSVLRQSYPHLELLVVDGGSTDGTVDILRELAPGVRWISEPDRGQADALNKGFQMSRGDVLGWLNADDLYEDGALFAVGEYFSSHPEAMWAAGPCSIVDENGREIRKAITWYRTLRLRHYSFRRHLQENFVPQMGVFFRRKALDAVGPLDISLHWTMDYDLWLRLGSRFNPGILHRRLGVFRMYGGTKSMNGFVNQFREDFEVVKRRPEATPWILFWHSLHNAKIVMAYRLIAWWSRIFGRRPAS
jgi:glycosyltransferase involved in cell wall biosynthesis